MSDGVAMEIMASILSNNLDRAVELYGDSHRIGCKALETAADAMGFEYLGSGAYAMALAHPDIDGVIKLNHMRFDPWSFYANYAMGHKDNPMVPVIYDFHRYDSGFGEVYIAHMERLAPAPITRSVGMIKVVRATAEFKETQPCEYLSLKKQIFRFLESWFEFDFSGAYNRGDLAKLILWMANICKERGFGPDCHPGNWMMRGDQLVLTDPIG